jgi:hypothetical protein
VVSFWEHELLRFHYAFVGLPGLDAFAYVHREEVLGAALAALMRVPAERRAELRAEAEQRVAVSRENAVRKRMLSECIEAYLSLEGADLEEYNRLLAQETYEEARTMAQTTFEKGVERGIERGQRALLLTQLEWRFGALSEGVRRRLEALPTDQLGDLAKALFTATSLRDLGLADE